MGVWHRTGCTPGACWMAMALKVRCRHRSAAGCLLLSNLQI